MPGESMIPIRLGSNLAVDEPLGCKKGLDDITGAAANRHNHGVVLLLAVELQLLQALQNSGASIESLHALQDEEYIRSSICT